MIDDRVRQAVLAVEVLGLVAQRVDLGDQVALVIAGLPHAAVGEAGFGHQRRRVVLVADGAAQGVGFFDQAGEFVALNR